MSKATQAPASIEGSELLVQGQKIEPNGPPKLTAGTKDNPSEMVFPLTVTIRGSSCILKEYIKKSRRLDPNSFLDEGSQISGQHLWGFSSNPLDRDSFDVGGKGRTSSHSGQSVEISGTCLMSIIKGWVGDPISIHPKTEFLE